MTGCGIDWIFVMSSAQTSKIWRYALMSLPTSSLRSCPEL